MYRGARQTHKWIGITLALFLAVLAVTGFFLATKKRFAWMQPPVAEAVAILSAGEIVSVERALEAAYALGHDNLQKLEHVDRVDYRPKDNIFKVISNEGYIEVQVDGKTGKVLSSSFRNDQLMEDIHDMSFFADLAHAWLLPAVAIGLATLAITGITLFLTPVYRRWQFRKTGVVKKRDP
ncbi:MAG: PepSY domain-containing protein [Fimbriimonas sp.]